MQMKISKGEFPIHGCQYGKGAGEHGRQQALVSVSAYATGSSGNSSACAVGTAALALSYRKPGITLRY